MISTHPRDSFELEGRGVLGPESNGIAPNAQDVTLSLGSFSLTIPAGSFVKKADRDEDNDDENRDRDDFLTTYEFRGVIAGVLVKAKIEQGRPKDAFRFQFEGRNANVGLVVNPLTVGLAIGDDTGHVVIKADIDK